MATPASWLKWQLIADDAMKFAPRPTVDQIIARMRVQRPRQAEEFLKEMASNEKWADELSAMATDSAFTPDTNIFGAPVKTIGQGRALGERNLPGIENLSPEDQIALAQALDKGAMLRSMSARSHGDPQVTYTQPRSVSSGGIPSQMPRVRWLPSDREQAITGAGTPFLGHTDLSMSGAMSLLQNRRDYARLTGLNPDVPAPPALSQDIRGRMVPSVTANALGDDVSDLVRAIRQDQVDSRRMQLDELQQSAMQDDMARSAGEVAAMEARAREYGNMPPETLGAMDSANRKHQSLMSGNTERLTDDDRYNWARQMGGNMDRVVGSPLYPKSQEHLIRDGETSAEYWWRRQGKDIIKGFGLGHILSYPLIYGAYKMMQPEESASLPPYEPARHLGDIATTEDEAWLEADREKTKAQTMAYLDSLPDVPIDQDAKQYRQGYEPSMPQDAFDLPQVPIELPEEPIAVMPRDEVGIPDVPLDDLTLSEENVAGAPAMDDLDAELVAAGLQPAATSRQGISSMEVDGRPVDSLYPPESLEYQREQAYKRRTRRNPYPALSY